MKNIFESKPVNHSCMGPFPEGLKEKYQKSAEIGRKYPEGIEVIPQANIDIHNEKNCHQRYADFRERFILF